MASRGVILLVLFVALCAVMHVSEAQVGGGGGYGEHYYPYFYYGYAYGKKDGGHARFSGNYGYGGYNNYGNYGSY